MRKSYFMCTKSEKKISSSTATLPLQEVQITSCTATSTRTWISYLETLLNNACVSRFGFTLIKFTGNSAIMHFQVRKAGMCRVQRLVKSFITSSQSSFWPSTSRNRYLWTAVDVGRSMSVTCFLSTRQNHCISYMTTTWGDHPLICLQNSSHTIWTSP